MSTAAPFIIETNNISEAWGHAFLHVMSPNPPRPFVVSIGGFTASAPAEDSLIRNAVDDALQNLAKPTAKVSGMMIFPFDMWCRRGKPDCPAFSETCLRRLLPRLKALDSRNGNGTYFARMMGFEGLKAGKKRVVNQLDFIIQLLQNPNRRPRHSALQISCFDPAKDHTGQPVRGFPCLQQVSFSYDDDDGLAVCGYYPSQYIFDRAYGNYLGLCHLGAFVAHQTGRVLRRMTCFTGQPVLGDCTKAKLRKLEELVRRRYTS